MRQPVASLIAAIIGELFIQLTAGSLPGPLVWPVRIVGAVVFLVVLWYAVLPEWQPAPPQRRPRPRRRFHTYYISLGLLILAIPTGIWLFQQVLPVPVLIVPWLVVLVGVHFFFFASAFSIPLFERMGAVLLATGIVGGAVVLQFASRSASGVTGVVAGFILLVFSAAIAPAGKGEAATGPTPGTR
jgi:hypothetical protein